MKRTNWGMEGKIEEVIKVAKDYPLPYEIWIRFAENRRFNQSIYAWSRHEKN